MAKHKKRKAHKQVGISTPVISRDSISREIQRRATRLMQAMEMKRQEAVGPAGASISGDPDANLPGAANYRPLLWSGRNLNAHKHERSLEVAYYLFLTNPLGKRLVTVGTDHVIGEGISVSSENEKADAVLKEFWDDPVNEWPIFQHQMADQLSVFGDQCYPVSINPVSGAVRLGYVDSTRIAGIKVDPNNERIITDVELRGTAKEITGQTLKVIRQDEDASSPTFGRLAGDCFYFRINAVMNALRGTPDLLPAADYLDGHDRLVFDRLELSALQRAYIFDVILEGANPTKIDEWIGKNRQPPSSGSIRAHNEKEKWSILTPDLKAADAKIDADALKVQAVMGGGVAPFPIHWFGEGETVNKASAIEMGSPAYRALLRRQAIISYMINRMCRFALHQRVGKGLTLEQGNAPIVVRMPLVASRDLVQASTTVVNTVSALTIAEDREWLSHQTSMAVAASAFSMFGVMVDPANEAKLIQEEKDNAAALKAKADQDEQNRLRDAINPLMDDRRAA